MQQYELAHGIFKYQSGKDTSDLKISSNKLGYAKDL